MIDTNIKVSISLALSLLPAKMTSPEALAMLYAIGLQESGMTARVQMNGGPARGLWQNERGGGVHGVLTSPSTMVLAMQVCAARGIQAAEGPVWQALASDDVLAAAFARLILYADPAPLPALDDVQGSWACYQRNWRPGKPRPDDWPGNHSQALQEL